MKKYEYAVVRFEAKDYNELTDMLNEYGMGGWELFYVDLGRMVGAALANCVFKRELDATIPDYRAAQPAKRGPGRPRKAA
jgi:hypothetical protein